jgi:hypothetical protein
MHDVFITHDWRRNADRDRVILFLDSQFHLDWRNFGTPWYDPAVEISSPDGSAFVAERLEEQVVPARVVVLVPEIYMGSRRGNKWVGLAVEYSRRDKKPIVGVLPANGSELPAEVRTLADVWVPLEALATAIEKTLSGAKPA